jgi:hypothetical protein
VKPDRNPERLQLSTLSIPLEQSSSPPARDTIRPENLDQRPVSHSLGRKLKLGALVVRYFALP